MHYDMVWINISEDLDLNNFSYDTESKFTYCFIISFS